MPESTSIRSFEKLNRLFLERLSDASLLRGERYSFLKIFQHALFYEQIGARKRVIANYLHWPCWLHALFLRLKAMLRSREASSALNECVFIDPARVVPDSEGNWHSIYMEKIGGLFSEQSVSMLNRTSEPRLKNRIALDKVSRNFGTPDECEMAMMREVHRMAKRVLADSQWTSLQKKHLLSELHLFFEDFRFYYSLFRKQPVKAVFFISHYHNEGLLAALSELNIRSIELQHGLIAANDLYYQYPAAFRDAVQHAFFPDHICVYGPYWKRILLKGCEFSESKIVVAGDYLWHPPAPKMVETRRNKVLICAQKNFHADYVQYALSLVPFMKQHPDWQWIVKLHPLEKFKKEYDQLKEHGFEIVGQERSLTALLREVRIHISIYSTTFFDALGFDVANYSIQNYSSARDYAAQMVAEGVAHPIELHEDPVEKLLLGQTLELPLKRSDVYSDFNPQAIMDLLS